MFSLEGCVEAGLLETLCSADLSAGVPTAALGSVGRAARASLRALLRAEGLLDRVAAPPRPPGDGGLRS